MTTRTIGLSWAIVAAVLVGVGSASTARADEHVVTKVPFPFIVGNTRMPAGTYVIRASSEDANLLSVENLDGGSFALTLTIPTGEKADGRPALTFARFDNEYFLSRITPPGLDGHKVVLTAGKMQRELDAVTAAQ